MKKRHHRTVKSDSFSGSGANKPNDFSVLRARHESGPAFGQKCHFTQMDLVLTEERPYAPKSNLAGLAWGRGLS